MPPRRQTAPWIRIPVLALAILVVFQGYAFLVWKGFNPPRAAFAQAPGSHSSREPVASHSSHEPVPGGVRREAAASDPVQLASSISREGEHTQEGVEDGLGWAGTSTAGAADGKGTAQQADKDLPGSLAGGHAPPPTDPEQSSAPGVPNTNAEQAVKEDAQPSPAGVVAAAEEPLDAGIKPLISKGKGAKRRRQAPQLDLALADPQAEQPGQGAAQGAGVGGMPARAEPAGPQGGAPSGTGGAGSSTAAPPRGAASPSSAGGGFGAPDDLSGFDVLVVGAGITGAVLADMYARVGGKRVLVVEAREHVGGLCYDYVDAQTGILVHKYGPHVFHTSKEHVWAYVHRFGEFVPYELREVARVKDKLVPLPANIETVRQLFNVTINSVEDMQKAMIVMGQAASGSLVSSHDEAALLREAGAGLQRIEDTLLKKWWNQPPAQLAGSGLGELKINGTWDDRKYPTDRFQGLPKDGYTKILDRMLGHPNITVRLQADYFALKDQIGSARQKGAVSKIFYTGPIDAFFKKREVNIVALQYRSLYFERHVLKDFGVVQPAAVVNYPEPQHGPSTRSVEYKHFYRQKSDYSVVVMETPFDLGEPMYPIPSQQNKATYAQYRELADKVEKEEGVHFVGRLAQYQDLEMADAIDTALELYSRLEGKQPAKEVESVSPVTKTRPFQGFVVHFVVALYGESVPWIKDVCSDAFFESPEVQTKWFLYVKKPDRTLQHTEMEVQQAMAGTHCEGSDVDVRRLENVGRETHTHLKHMFGAQSGFGDANIFLQGKVHAEISKIVCGLSTMKRQLWDDTGMTRATHPLNLHVDVSRRDRTRIGPSTNHTLELCRKDLPLYRHHLPQELQALTDNHFIPLHPLYDIWRTFPRVKIGLKAVYWRYFVKLRYAPHLVFQKSEFIVSDAGIRRLLAKYRTLLWDMALDQDLSFLDWILAGTVFEWLWYSLFNDVPEDFPTIDFLQDETRMRSVGDLLDHGKEFLAPTFNIPNPTNFMRRFSVYRRGAVFDTHAPEPRPYKGFPQRIENASEVLMASGPTLKATRSGAVVRRPDGRFVGKSPFESGTGEA